MNHYLRLLTFLTAVIFSCVFPFTGAATDESGHIQTDRDEGESNLRTLEYLYGESGLTFLRVIMKDGSGRVFERDSFPPNCKLDTYHDGDEILIDYFPDEALLERWAMTFAYIDGDWRLTFVGNSPCWMISVENGLYTFHDYFDDPVWQWSIRFDDRLTVLNFVKLEFLVELYDMQMPERSSLADDWEE